MAEELRPIVGVSDVDVSGASNVYAPVSKGGKKTVAAVVVIFLVLIITIVLIFLNSDRIFPGSGIDEAKQAAGELLDKINPESEGNDSTTAAVINDITTYDVISEAVFANNFKNQVEEIAASVAADSTSEQWSEQAARLDGILNQIFSAGDDDIVVDFIRYLEDLDLSDAKNLDFLNMVASGNYDVPEMTMESRDLWDNAVDWINSLDTSVQQ